MCLDHLRPLAGTPALTAWRTRPWRFHARHRADLCAVLAELTIGAGVRARTLVAAAVRDHDSTGCWQLALELGRHPACGTGDLPMAWAALAGARCHALATLAVAQRLAELDDGTDRRHRARAAGWARLAAAGAVSIIRRPDMYRPVDLSQVSWILTANNLRQLSEPLLSRVMVIQVRTLLPEHFGCVLASIPQDMAQDLGCAVANLLPLSAAAADVLRSLCRGDADPPDPGGNRGSTGQRPAAKAP